MFGSAQEHSRKRAGGNMDLTANVGWRRAVLLEGEAYGVSSLAVPTSDTSQLWVSSLAICPIPIA